MLKDPERSFAVGEAHQAWKVTVDWKEIGKHSSPPPEKLGAVAENAEDLVNHWCFKY